jgi:hypothetical protein
MQGLRGADPVNISLDSVAAILHQKHLKQTTPCRNFAHIKSRQRDSETGATYIDD